LELFSECFVPQLLLLNSTAQAALQESEDSALHMVDPSANRVPKETGSSGVLDKGNSETEVGSSTRWDLGSMVSVPNDTVITIPGKTVSGSSTALSSMVLTGMGSSSMDSAQIHTAPALFTATGEWAALRTAVVMGSSSLAEVWDNNTEQGRDRISVPDDDSGDLTTAWTGSAVHRAQALAPSSRLAAPPVLNSAAPAAVSLGVPGADSGDRGVKILPDASLPA
jgi:hypothetical protein